MNSTVKIALPALCALLFALGAGVLHAQDATNAPANAPSSPPSPDASASATPVATGEFSVKPTAKGLLIDTGGTGTYTLYYPALLNPTDGGVTPMPNQVVLKPDGSGATLTYKPSGQATLDLQPDGSWLYHFTDIPLDRMKLAFGLKFPAAMADGDTTWSFDGTPPAQLPKVKGGLNLYQGNPKTFVFTRGQGGFTITYPKRTWVVFTDQRVWGKTFFDYIDFFYFPNKKHVPEISYSIRVDNLPKKGG